MKDEDDFDRRLEEFQRHNDNIEKVMRWVAGLVFIACVALFLFLVSGCAQTNVNDVAVQQAYFDAQARIAVSENTGINGNNRPTVEMVCGTGCRFERFTVNIPDKDGGVKHTILNRPKTSAETGADVAKVYARPIESIFTMGLGVFGINEIVKSVGKNAGTSNSVSGEGNSISVSEGNVITSSDGNVGDITSDTNTESSSSVGDAITSDDNSVGDTVSDNSNTDNSIIDSNDQIDNSVTNNNYPIDGSYNDNSQTAPPAYPPPTEVIIEPPAP